MIKLLDIANQVLEEQQQVDEASWKSKVMAPMFAAAAAAGGLTYLNRDKAPDEKIVSVQSEFNKATKSVIDSLEGAYVNPSQLTNKRERRAFSKSGETMFGIDRKTGGKLNTSDAGRKFWELIDADKKKNPEKWVRYYDGGEIKGQLQDLASQIMEPEFERLFKVHFSPKEQQIIKSDPRLFFHFAYATWNGPGWFRKFANSIKREIRQGNTDTNSLFNIAIDDRKDAGGIIGAKADKVKMAAQS
jgi:uncharacterized protein (DUF2147 family)